MKTNIKGVGVALITPFTNSGAVDFEALGRLVDHVTAGGVDYLVVLGTTGETPTLSREEKNAVARFVIAQNNGQLPIMVGIGGNNTADVVANIREFDFEGVDMLLSVVPYYNKPSQEGIYQHYKAVAEVSPRPVMLYNVPGRTGVNMCATTTLRLACDFDNIVAIKEASGNLSQVSYILRDRPEGFLVVSGDDNLTLPMIALGGDGIISVAANSFPVRFSEMVHMAMQERIFEAAKLHMSMMETVDTLFEEGNPVGVKAALSEQGVISNYLRLPLVAASPNLSAKLKQLIACNNLK